MATYTNKSFSTATYTKQLGTHDGWFYDDTRVTYDSNVVTYDYFGTPAVYTNQTFVAGDTELLIDSTYSLLIDGTYSLLAEEGIKWGNQARQASTYANIQISNSGRTAQELLIQDAFELLIDGTYSLEIQDEVASQVYTNKVRNN